MGAVDLPQDLLEMPTGGNTYSDLPSSGLTREPISQRIPKLTDGPSGQAK